MKSSKKIFAILGVTTLVLSLFSFKSADSNEANMGEVVVYATSVSPNGAASAEQARRISPVVNFTKETAKKVKEAVQKTAQEAQEAYENNTRTYIETALLAEAVTSVFGSTDPFDVPFSSQTQKKQKLSKL